MSTILPREFFELELGFTQIYQENIKEHKAVREARCLAWQLPRIILDIDDDDLVPGGCDYGAVGFSSQIGGFLYYYHEDKIRAEINRCQNQAKYVDQLENMLRFWKQENSRDNLRLKYTDRQLLALPTDDWEREKAVTYPLYRIAGAILDFSKLLSLGLHGLYAEVENQQRKYAPYQDAYSVYEGMKIALETLKEVIQCYRNRAEEKEIFARKKGDKDTGCRMNAIKRAMEAIKTDRPKHLLEAVELFWMYVVVSEVRNYGRIDIYLGDFYADDIDSGYLTREEADTIIRKLWERMGKRRTITDGRVMVGGRGRKNEEHADRLAIACIQATRILKNPDPQLSLRFYQGMKPELMELAMEAIGEGCTYPVLYNDDVIIRDVQKAFALPEKAAENYVPYGCGEYVIDHQSFGTPSGVINLLKGLEIFLNYGWEQDASYLEQGKGQSVLEAVRQETGAGKSFEEYHSFTEFYEDYKKFIAFHIEIIAQQEKMEYDFAAETCCLPYLSMLYDNCIREGKGIFEGGIKYLGGTLESYGNVNTADSLYAIEKLVFEEKKIGKEELLLSVKADFQGYERIQKQLKDCDKFGNDQEGVDRLMRDLHRFVCITAKEQAKKAGLDSYLVVIINNSANTSLGLLTGASPDGRNSGKPMANANSPQAQGDRNGITAVLNSMLKMDSDIHAGSVQNIKFSKETFNDYRDAARSVIEAYFEQGGAQLMITVVGREDLEEAVKHPQDYMNLLVRVGGFSARFVELSEEVQADILSRTCY